MSQQPGPGTSPSAVRVLRFTRYPRYALYIFGIVFVLILWANFRVPILNPVITQDPYNWIVTYPPSPPGTIKITNASLVLMMSVTASQIIADGVLVTIAGRGCMDSSYAQKVREVSFGFIGGYSPPIQPNGFQASPFGAVRMFPYSSYTVVGGGPNPGWLCPAPVSGRLAYLIGNSTTFIFRSAREYPSTIEIIPNDQTVNSTVYSYQDFTVLVESSRSLRQDDINKSILTITGVAFVFAVADLIPKFKKEDTGSQAESTQASLQEKKLRKDENHSGST